MISGLRWGFCIAFPNGSLGFSHAALSHVDALDRRHGTHLLPGFAARTRLTNTL
jgi:hypothetical protein